MRVLPHIHYNNIFILMKRKIYFDPKFRKLKKYRLIFHCSLFNAQLSGCDLDCHPCPAKKYKEKEVNGTNSNSSIDIADSS